MMNPRERVEAALLNRWADRVPFAVYANKIFPSQIERELRNNGMCIVEPLRVQPFIVETPDVSAETIYYRSSVASVQQGAGRTAINPVKLKRVIRTPEGTLSEVYTSMPGHPRIPDELVPWHDEYLFKSPDDYAPIASMIRNRRYLPNYEAFRRAQEEAGGDVLLVPAIGYSPLQELLIEIMGLEQFSVEWHFRRDRVLQLYQVLTEDRRKLYPVVAQSPALVVNYCGNVSPEVMGLNRFRQYVLPHYDEFAAMLHEHGKLLAVHFDANNRLFASAIAESQIDCIEAFTPPPNGDMSVAEAREAWPDKTLWVNFPSAVHLDDPASVEQMTRLILRQAVPGNRFILGVTETVPRDRWPVTFSVISRLINQEGRLPLQSG